jgi:hypothetical protein
MSDTLTASPRGMASEPLAATSAGPSSAALRAAPQHKEQPASEEQHAPEQPPHRVWSAPHGASSAALRAAWVPCRAPSNATATLTLTVVTAGVRGPRGAPVVHRHIMEVTKGVLQPYQSHFHERHGIRAASPSRTNRLEPQHQAGAPHLPASASPWLVLTARGDPGPASWPGSPNSKTKSR